MMTIDASPQILPVGLANGKSTPYAILNDSRCKDAETWSDGTTGTHGFLYPTNYASTEQTLINTNVTAMQGYFQADDNIFAGLATKKKVLGSYFNGVSGINNMALYTTDMIGTGTTVSTTDSSSSNVDCVEIATDKVLYIYPDSGDSDKLKGRIGTLTGTGTITLGTEFTIDTTASAFDMKCKQISTDKFVVIWVNSNTTKAIVATVSGTTPTFGTKVDLSTNSNEMIGLEVISTDKFVGVFIDNTSNDVMARVCTCTGTTTVTMGTSTAVVTGTDDPVNGAAQNTVAKLDTDKFCFIYNEGPGTYNIMACSVSGTTPTPGTASPFATTTFLKDLTIRQLTTDKVIVAGVNTAGTGLRAQVVTYAALVATLGTVKSVATIGSVTSLTNFVKISATKGIILKFCSVSAVSGFYMWPVTISGSDIYVGDVIMLLADNSTLAGTEKVIETTNYTTMVSDIAGANCVAWAVKDINVDITVNDTLYVNDTAVKLYESIVVGAPTYGRKQYIQITNNNATSQTIKIQNVIASVD